MKKILARNATRVIFSEMYQRVIDNYNAGTAESEQAFKDLMEILKKMKEEKLRAAREGLTDQQLEICVYAKQAWLSQSKELPRGQDL